MAIQRFGEIKHIPISPAMREYLVKSCSPVDPVMTRVSTML